jgi:acetyl-CoA acyltransferase
MSSEALIVDAVRSPIGKRNGTFASLRADELAGQVLDALVQRFDLDPGAIEDVELGCVTQVGEQAINIARIASLAAGWPETVCGATVDRQCGSSMHAAFGAASSVHAYSYESHRRAIAAIDDGKFEREVVPVEVSNPHVGVLFSVDETPRRDTSPEKLASLKPVFKDDGRITAWNSSQICDGAAALLLASERSADELGLTPRGRFVSSVSPASTPTGCCTAIRSRWRERSNLRGARAREFDDAEDA